MTSVTIIGDGRLGRALALAFDRAGIKVDAIVAHVAERAGIGSIMPVLLADLPTIESDVVLIATQDASIATAASALGDKIADGVVVLHTSGSIGSEVLRPAISLSCPVGAFHPLASISEPESGSKRFAGAFICVEGDEKAVTLARLLAETLQARPFEVASDKKPLYHAAAVTAAGHLVALIDIAAEMMAKCGISTEDAREILQPLVRTTVENLEDRSTAKALTGPFARADIETFERNLGAIRANCDPEIERLYLLLGKRSLDLAAANGVSPDAVEILRQKISVATRALR